MVMIRYIEPCKGFHGEDYSSVLWLNILVPISALSLLCPKTEHDTSLFTVVSPMDCIVFFVIG